MKHKDKMKIVEQVYMCYYHGDDVWWGSISNRDLLSELLNFRGHASIKVEQDNAKVIVTINIKP